MNPVSMAPTLWVRAVTGKRIARAVLVTAGLLIALSGVVTALNFPYDTDPPVDTSKGDELTGFYRETYTANSAAGKSGVAAAHAQATEESFYVRTNREAALKWRIPEEVQSFVETFRLKDKRVLEIGAGSGLLQDLVDDYTALDISPTARRFFHKPFVEGSATAMPFSDGAFDAVWSIWVLEHIPNPERALNEMRRVVKNNGYMLL